MMALLNGWRSIYFLRSQYREIAQTAFLVDFNFFKLRTTPASHPQMREIAIPLLKAFAEMIPVVSDDIVE